MGTHKRFEHSHNIAYNILYTYIIYPIIICVKYDSIIITINAQSTTTAN